ncbi:MAG: DUF4398 domain-containing protein [Myxococcota bacterium]
MQTSKLLLSSAVFALAAACSSRNAPPAASADAKAAISAAEAVGAQSEPQAALHLKLARDQTTKADALARDGKDEEARAMIERAKIDAELALVLTRDASVRAQANNEAQRLRELEQNN